MSAPAKGRVRFPDPLTLLTGCVLIGAALSYILPAGEYERRDDPVTGRSVVVAGTFHEVERQPVNAFEAVVALPRGMADAGSVIFLVFLIGGAFFVVDETGTLRRGVGWLAQRLANRELLVIPVVSLAFAAGGVLENMAEEIIPLIPVLIILTRRLGFDAITATSMSAGAAFVGSAFSPINPFQAGIAQKVAELPLLSGGWFRIVFLVLALGVWIGGTMRYARRTRSEVAPQESVDFGTVRKRDVTVLGLVVATFAILVFGLLRLGWGFDEMSALFFIMGVIAGVLSGLGIAGTADAFVKGFKAMTYAALLIGFARAIFVVLQDGRIVDTIVNAIFTPVADLPVALSALGMMVAQAAIHVPVPSVSGQAVLTLPVLVPVADLLGLSRQVTVLAYQYGAGLCELLTPTNGALMAILAAAEVPYQRWLRFAVPLYVLLLALGAVAILVGIGIGLN